MPVQEETLTTGQSSRLIKIIGSEIKVISPKTKLWSIEALRRRTAQRCLCGGNAPRTIEELVDYLISEAAAIEAPERQRYDDAVAKADLPAEHAGEIFIRGWRCIARYDHRKGSLKKWLWGFVRCLNHEDKRTKGMTLIETPETFGDFEETSRIRHQVRGFRRVKQLAHETTLLELEWDAICAAQRHSPDDFAVFEAVHCHGKERDQVALDLGFANRNGVDQAICRFRRRVRDIADRMREEHT